MHKFTFGLLSFVFAITDAAAQPKIDKFSSIVLSSIEPTIDGKLNADEWDDATLIDDLYQVRPNEYAPPSEKTEFFIKYDKDALYVAAKLYEKDPSQITARISRQGANNRSDDRMIIFLDPYNSKRAGYAMSLSLNEVRRDGIYVNTTTFSDDWDGIWEGKAERTDYGWSAEIAIPFKTMTFEADNETWGFNAFRYLARNNEISGWVSKNRSNNASISGQLQGFKGIEQGMGLDIVSGLSFNNSRVYSPQDDDFNVEPSVDLFYKMTSSLNGSLTINTDFSATEVDDRQVDLSQFSLFFPEKRDFFLREFDIFDFGGIGSTFRNAQFSAEERQNARPFFSRTIGLSSTGEQVDIIAGGKISGKVAGYDVGALAVQQDSFEDIDSSTLFVGRFAKDVLGESSIGTMLTYGDPTSNIDNSLVGVDFRYRNSNSAIGKRIDASLWYQKTDTDGLVGEDSAFGATLSLPDRAEWQGIAQYQRVEQNFNPALGFVSRTGVELKRGVLGYTFRYDTHPWMRSIYTGVNSRQWDFLDDGREQSSRHEFLPLVLTTQPDDRLQFNIQRLSEGVYEGGSQPLESAGITLPYGLHEWSRAGLIFTSSKSRPYDLRFVLFDGDYYTGERFAREIDIGWRPTSKLQFELKYRYWDVELPEGDFELRQASARTEWVFNSTLSWVNVVQYDNISSTMGINSRLHWTPRAGQDVFFVINHNFDELENDEFVSTANEITLKASYTFRF